jgi:hypothetical protein
MTTKQQSTRDNEVSASAVTTERKGPPVCETLEPNPGAVVDDLTWHIEHTKKLFVTHHRIWEEGSFLKREGWRNVNGEEREIIDEFCKSLIGSFRALIIRS